MKSCFKHMINFTEYKNENTFSDISKGYLLMFRDVQMPHYANKLMP